ncbi:intraflagellar transport protein 140 homolog isoform X3 [Hydra vulgaris]|uniref:Intraflagellar transport protein 140 homolog isoform X3 n=1 Tax=Hydra vulgaris TaxID=6087 RepID=A0ABM4CEH4_HYDVU
MAVYFDYKILPHYEDSHCSLTSWHSNFPLLAVGFVRDSTGYVALYLDEGEHIENSKIEREFAVSKLSWHPHRKILASGWKNGCLIIWNEHTKEWNEAPKFHLTEITCIWWNRTGSRLITSDQTGLVCVWKIDQRGKFQQSPMFKNELRSSVVSGVLKVSVGLDVSIDITAAAKAAVSGNKNALDLFDMEKSSNFSNIEEIQLFIATKDGNVYFLDEKGKCKSCFKVDSSILYLLYYENQDVVVTITDALFLTQHSLKDGNYKEISKVKLSGQASSLVVTWAGSGIIAISSKSHVVRLIDIRTDQNFVLNLDKSFGFKANECINFIAFSHSQGTLAGGTDQGHVALWKYNSLKNDDQLWVLQPPSDVVGSVTHLEWGASLGLIAVNCVSSVTILNKATMSYSFSGNIAAVQLSPAHLLIKFFPSLHVEDLKTDMHIKGVHCNKNHAAIWNGKKVAIYEIPENKSFIRSAGSFTCDAHKVAVYEQNVYLVDSHSISIRTFQGTVKQELTFLEKEGDPFDLDICRSHMVVATNRGVLKIYDLSRREARQVSVTKHLEDCISKLGKIHLIKINCNGTKVAVLSQNSNYITAPVLYVWEVESDKIQSFNFMSGESNYELLDDLLATQQQLTDAIKGYVPKSVFWDSIEPKLLVCETVRMSSINQEETSIEKDLYDNNSLIVTMFSCPEYGLVVQDHFKIDSTYTGLLGMDTPFCYFIQSGQHRDQCVARKTMRDFVEFENGDLVTKAAMMSYSYLSAIGNMDEAFKAIKSIKSPSVWENMARMCVKTKRLDVAFVCLGNMGNAAAVKAIRDAQLSEVEVDAHVAMLAIQVGMHEEAEQLYKNCHRYDLLNIFYQASNNWTQAIECAEKHDRIHLRTTFYCYGQYLEDLGNKEGAVENFEKSGTFRFEVPRMMMDDVDELQAYILKKKDRELMKWWARYLESLGDMEAALFFYKQSEDYLSMVRIHCFCENMKEAEQLCQDTGDKAACYHLACQFEISGNIPKSIHFFSRAQCYSNAIRLAKEKQLDQELMNLSMLSTQEDMLSCAQYFEEKGGMDDKAIALYHRGGSVSKAIDLAFSSKQFGALQLISDDLDENVDPQVLHKCADFFIENDQFDKAVNLLIASKKFEEALRMCLDHDIQITEEIAEKMTFPKEHSDAKYRLYLLEKIGECAYKQGSFHLATKKFTQAGNKMKAMKSLLKSGDTEKIVFFAGVSRQKEIYVMAANYLQSLDWQKDPEILKNIISFYTKGRALESLSTFYESCAQVEIDEFENYEKAFGALTEAYKCLSKAKPKNVTVQEEKLALIKTKLTLMKKYIHARKEYSSTPDESVSSCELLLEDPDVNVAIQVKHIYAFLIEHYVNVRNYKKAYHLMEDFRKCCPSVKLEKVISKGHIQKVYTELGIALKPTKDKEIDKDPEEEIDEEDGYI